MSLVTRAPTDVVVCARCGPSSPFDEDPELASRQDELVAQAEEAAAESGKEVTDPSKIAEGGREILVTKRYPEEIRENVAAALLGKKLLPHETPFLAGTIPCDECGGDPKVVRHTPNPSAFLQLEQSFQTDASLTAGDFAWPLRPGFPRAYLPQDEEEVAAEEEEREMERERQLYTSSGQPLVFPRRSGRAAVQQKMGAAAAAVAMRRSSKAQQRSFGEAPSRPRMDFFWRDLLASAKASPWNVAARYRGGAGEDGDGGWTTSDDEEEEGVGAGAAAGGGGKGGKKATASSSDDDDDDEDKPQELPEYDEFGDIIDKKNPRKMSSAHKEPISIQEEERIVARGGAEAAAILKKWKKRGPRGERKVRKLPPPLTLDELFGEELAETYMLPLEVPWTVGGRTGERKGGNKSLRRRGGGGGGEEGGGEEEGGNGGRDGGGGKGDDDEDEDDDEE